MSYLLKKHNTDNDISIFLILNVKEFKLCLSCTTHSLAFKLNGISHFRNISGAIWEDNTFMANEEILLKVNLVKHLSLPNRLPVLVTTEGRASSLNSYPHITIMSKVLHLEMFYKAL